MHKIQTGTFPGFNLTGLFWAGFLELSVKNKSCAYSIEKPGRGGHYFALLTFQTVKSYVKCVTRMAHEKQWPSFWECYLISCLVVFSTRGENVWSRFKLPSNPQNYRSLRTRESILIHEFLARKTTSKTLVRWPASLYFPGITNTVAPWKNATFLVSRSN